MAYGRPAPAIPKPRMNQYITAPELRVIGEQGENLGVLSLGDALKLTRPADGLDLIEISPKAVPPVARLMSWDKYRYEEEKRLKKERMAQKGPEMKHVQITARAGEHDLLVRVNQVEKFFHDGHPVEINMRLRGREKANKTWAFDKLEAFLKMIPTDHKRLTTPRFLQHGPSVQIAKKAT